MLAQQDAITTDRGSQTDLGRSLFCPEFANLCPEGANRFGVSAASPLGYPDSYVELLKIWH